VHGEIAGIGQTWELGTRGGMGVKQGEAGGCEVGQPLLLERDVGPCTVVAVAEGFDTFGAF
jgi:hypothetical protein